MSYDRPLPIFTKAKPTASVSWWIDAPRDRFTATVEAKELAERLGLDLARRIMSRVR